ncbi:MAG: hypothetical protein LKF37_06195 [Lentilactobacillus diolivorans]|jgi:hypothetical protein|uniref:Uncharacterized protein n=1 Tax=Lentilactobacillus diolivorans TaxID=179838 RepID=A0ABQ0XH44_9LACO|nr:hypothetical protein [Lentilactobacillus diolivorans]MCH4164361.1 hypothetical protein [Lentilactobacillus diolivorans]MDH5106178.1 hypothetical protein [Lentilactobacillus diolivorans]RRG01814.1 MAG: hypothetical protein DUD34_10595 [Lactobacillus sp.]GEP23764.1 hypothetical protein LDI01_13570 [Lentilactobacillus diolivorans]
MQIWSDFTLYLLILVILLGGITWLLLSKWVHVTESQPLKIGLEVLLTLIGLASNGLGVIFLISPFHNFGYALIIGVIGILVGVLFLFEVFMFFQKRS